MNSALTIMGSAFKMMKMKTRASFSSSFKIRNEDSLIEDKSGSDLFGPIWIYLDLFGSDWPVGLSPLRNDLDPRRIRLPPSK